MMMGINPIKLPECLAKTDLRETTGEWGDRWKKQTHIKLRETYRPN